MPSGLSTSGANGPSATTACLESSGPSALSRRQCPSARRSARVATHHHAAERGKTRGISLGHRKRVSDAGGPRPEHGVPKDRREIRLELARPIGIEHVLGHPEFLRQREFTFERIECAIAAIELEPACLAQEALRAGLREQRLVLDKRARKQRTYQPRGLDQPLGA